MNNEKLQPIDVEEALVGAIVTNPELIDTCGVDAHHFYLERCRIVFETIGKLRRQGQQADYITLIAALKNTAQLETIGGAQYVTKLASGQFWGHNADSYGAIVRESARRRNLLDIANRTATLATNGDDIDAALPDLIDGMTRSAGMTGRSRLVADVMSDIYDEVEQAMNNPVDTWGIPTGFPAYDRVTGGMQLGESIMMSGEPGVGKSLLVMGMAANMAKSEPGVIYSMEMLDKSVGRRWISDRAKIATSALKKGTLSPEDYNRFLAAIEHLSALPITISDASDWTTSAIRADLARLKATRGIKWFVVDYLHLLADGKDTMGETERTAMCSRGLKNAAMSLNLSGIVINSMTKEGMNSGKPTQTGMRGSGQVLHDADIITFLTKYPPEGLPGERISPTDRDNVRVLWFAKGRELESDKKYIVMVKQPGFPSFAEYRSMP